MNRPAIKIAVCCAVFSGATAIASPGPNPSSLAGPIAAPKDRAYPGEIRIAVDASDVGRRIVPVEGQVVGPVGAIHHQTRRLRRRRIAEVASWRTSRKPS